MNTSQLKRFAKEARIKLINQVGRKLEFVLTHDTAELRGQQSEITQLKQKIQEDSKGHVIETVAYTWFNRLMALRFMDANGYTMPKIVTPLPGMTNPEILQNALAGNVEEDLRVDRQRINDLLDGRTANADAHTEAYKMLLVATCNYWHTTMPFMFERISDYTELLLPDDLLSDYSIVADIRNGMSDEDCQQEELIGWLYQFYIEDKKDEVFDELKKNIKITAENIPAATQLFTPRWIVRYMVENTLGKLWLTFKPNSNLRQYMPYYMEAPEGNTPALLPEGIKGITDITFLDPCQGSGHMLVYAFELLSKIYEEEGYNLTDIPSLILRNNIFGFDIDDRAAQLSAFALVMKARSYYTRFLRKIVQPNVFALKKINEEAILQSIILPININGIIIEEIEKLTLYHFTNTDNFGSLIRIEQEEVNALQIQESSIWQEQQLLLKEQAKLLSQKYYCVVTNPPYMGSKSMEKSLLSFCSTFYPNSKADLYATFIERCSEFTVNNGFFSIINQHQWMFNEDYKILRRTLQTDLSIITLLHLGPRTFPEISGEVVQNVAFVIKKSSNSSPGVYLRLVTSKNKEVDFKEYLISKKDTYVVLPAHFKHFPDWVFGYWISEDVAIKLKTFPILKFVANAKKGFYSGDDSQFIRFWYEVSAENIALNCKDEDEFLNSSKRFAFVSKGGGYRKWYGNHYFVCDWGNRGYKIKNIKDNNGKQKSRTQNLKYNFREGLTWNAVSSNDFCCRFVDKGQLFTDVGPTIFDFPDPYYLAAYLQGDFGNQIFKLYCPTLKFEVGKVQDFPIFISNNQSKISAIAESCINLSKEEWDTNEISINFVKPQFLYSGLLINNLESVKRLMIERNSTFKNNEMLIDNLINSELEVPHFKDVNFSPDLYSQELIFDEIKSHYSINALLIVNQLCSYFVGCIYGRYSIDKPGLILTSQGATLKDFLKHVPNSTLIPNDDNIVPVLDGEWFADDILDGFQVFLKAAFGEAHFDVNIKFIEDIIGKSIRRYFVKDFYNDHIKRYKKRPIYWMFSSSKGHFKALIYMHRYQPDLCSKILNDYLQPFINKLEGAKQSQTMFSLREDISAREKVMALKEIDRLEAMLKDCREYERTLFTVATRKITIDLDDGVKVNYQKFKDVLVPIKGLEKEDE